MDNAVETLRILVADDHPIFLHGLRTLLEAEAGFTVVGEAKNTEEAVALARRLQPDLLLLDLAMPGQSGLEALRALGSPASKLCTIVLTAAIERQQIVTALQLGARGIVLKSAASQVLFKCIRAVLAGQYWVGHENVPDLVRALLEVTPPPTDEARRRNFGLTPREREIVTAVVAGYTNKDMAQKFSITEPTVKHHLTNIFDKLGVSNRLELALFALNHQLIEGSN
jgi:two-component system, NarL family, nitrate/nitrite response regulator NarL